MYEKKTGYLTGNQKTWGSSTGKTKIKGGFYKTKNIGLVPPQLEEGVIELEEIVDIDSIANGGYIYYQVFSNAEACEKCLIHDEAIYSVEEAKEGYNLPPFHPNCKCRVEEYSTKNLYNSSVGRETLLWLDMMYANGTIEQKARKLLDYYGFTEFSLEFIANILSEISYIGHISNRIAGFFEKLDELPSASSLEVERL